MPRTFQATVALIVTLIVIGLLTIINVWQTNQTEAKLVKLTQAIDNLNVAQRDIQDQLKRGVAVSGDANGNAGGAVTKDGKWADPYADQIGKGDNILKVATDDLIADNGVEGGPLREAISSDPKGFNWLTENSVDVSNLQELVHDTFARRDFKDPDTFVPRVAYKIEVSPDYKVYTIHLREGVYWQVPPHPEISSDKMKWMREPRELTAEDAAFTFEMIKNPQVEAGSLRNYFEDMEKVEVVDKYTLKVIWKKKTYQSMSATLSMYPMPKWLYTKNEDGTDIDKATLGLKFNSHWASQYPIGTGPYRFAKYEKGVGIWLERNESYWGEKPHVTSIERLIVKDNEQRLLKLKADEIDFTALTASQYNTEILKGKDTPFTRNEINHKIVDRFAYYYIGWNADRPMFADKRVRRAMTHAFNRQAIVDNVFFKLGTIQTGPYYYKHPANDPSVQPLGFDLDKARALLDEAGWKDTDGDGVRDKVINGEKIKLEFQIMAYANSPEWASSLSIFKEDLRKVGVSMDFSPLDWPTMQKKMNEKKFDAFTGGWGLSWEIDPYQLWHSSQADEAQGSNRVAFRNKRADEIIVELRKTFDADKRLELAQEFHRILHEEQPYTFFFSPQSVAVWQPRLQNFQVQSIRPQFYPLPWYIDQSKQPKKSK
ncbi:MAG: ABC transporter substrate-binding protein [Myxococcota bacterium]|nr:ABC transporter substrate-binding protein [Myxococcota bacterium]